MLEIKAKVFYGSIGHASYKIESDNREKEIFAKDYFEKKSEEYLNRFLNMKITLNEYDRLLNDLINHCYVGNYYSFAKVTLIPFSFRPIEIDSASKKTENIKINEKNISRIQAACKLANGRATTRTLNYNDVLIIASDILQYLIYDLDLRYKSKLADIVVYYDNSEILPKAYKYQAAGTQAEFTFDSYGNIILKRVFRADINKYTNKKYRYIFTESAKNQILLNMSVQ